jgi:hypothetical protein
VTATAVSLRGWTTSCPKPIDVAALDRDGGRRQQPRAASPATGAVGADVPGACSALDDERLELLRRLGPDDGWGLLPAVVDAYLDESPRADRRDRRRGADGDHAVVVAGAHKLNGAAATHRRGRCRARVRSNRVGGAGLRTDLRRGSDRGADGRGRACAGRAGRRAGRTP